MGMVDRLVLGSGSLAQMLVESLVEKPGSVRVVTADERRAQSFRDAGITVIESEPADEQTLLDLTGVEMVIAASDQTATNRAAIEVAATAFPDAHLVAYAGEDAADHGASFAELADTVIDPGQIAAGYIMDRVGDSGVRMRQLWRILRETDRLAIVTHDNPDPDAIASGVALVRLASAAGCQAEVCYYGEITHQENRAFVNVLDLELRNLDENDSLDEFDGFALVDHSRPSVNDQLPEDLAVDIVIDHHPPRAPVDARFVDLRSDVGATSTLLVSYLEHFSIEITETVATALLFGIQVDTKDFSRELSKQDFTAASTLVQHANLGTLERIESPSLSPQTVDTVANAIQNRTIEGEVLMSCVGELSDRDALAQAADRLLMLEGVTTTLVYGIKDGTIFASARARGTDVDLGEAVREAFGQIGSAGGHVDMAGAQITLGVLDAVEEREESLVEIVESIISSRFLDAVEAQTSQRATGIYTGAVDASDEFLIPEGDRPETGSEDA